MSWVAKPSKNVGPQYPDKPEGWFSRRYQTREYHDAAVQRYLSLHGPKARKARAA